MGGDRWEGTDGEDRRDRTDWEKKRTGMPALSDTIIGTGQMKLLQKIPRPTWGSNPRP